MQIPLIDLKKQYQTIQVQTDKEVLQVLHSANYIMGENVREFEKELSDYLNIDHSISVANGTDALIIALKALGIGEGDEVITSTYTYFATAESISFVGAKPVFVDVELDTFNIDVSKIEEKITDRTKAIMPVHIFGQACDMDEIQRIAKKYKLYTIEDTAQAIGAEYKGKKVGTLSDIATFSFFPTKNLGCAGDGGMIVTNNEKLATICRALKVHGSGENGRQAYNLINDIKEDDINNEQVDNTVYNPQKYYNYLIGHNSRLDELQAAILRIKLRQIDKWNEKRAENARYFNEELKDTNLTTPYKADNMTHIYHMYILQSEKRAGIVECLKEKGISTGIYYPVPLHLQKVYEDLGYKKGDLPNSEYLSERTFAIPVYPELSQEEKSYIVDKLKGFGE